MSHISAHRFRRTVHKPREGPDSDDAHIRAPCLRCLSIIDCSHAEGERRDYSGGKSARDLRPNQHRDRYRRLISYEDGEVSRSTACKQDPPGSVAAFP